MRCFLEVLGFGKNKLFCKKLFTYLYSNCSHLPLAECKQCVLRLFSLRVTCVRLTVSNFCIIDNMPEYENHVAALSGEQSVNEQHCTVQTSGNSPGRSDSNRRCDDFYGDQAVCPTCRGVGHIPNCTFLLLVPALLQFHCFTWKVACRFRCFGITVRFRL